MPELPEVETIARELDRKIRNRVIRAMKIDAPKMVNLPASRLNQILAGQKIKAVSRRAKMIILELSGGDYLLIHLKLTGQLVYRQKSGRVTAVGGRPIASAILFLILPAARVYFLMMCGNSVG
ncbi:MAG: DNA-formamidopyrimidine glycosylase family protein [Patescibacteria group bacterium]|jgi:formamidopyrimidine-DNA glycosylase